MAWLGSRRETEDGALRDSFRVLPVETEDASASGIHHDEDGVSWSALVERGVRVNLDVRISRDGDLYVESWHVSRVLEDNDSGLYADIFRGEADLPVGAESVAFGSVPEPSDEFVKADSDESRGDGNEDASSDTEHDAEHSDWSHVLGRLLTPQRVRLTLSGAAV